MTVLATKIRDVGSAQRLLLWSILLSIVGWIFLPLVVIAIPIQIYSIFKLAKALTLSTSSAIMYAIAMFVPLVSLVCLVVLNNKATVYLQSNGIPVGLMGAKRSDLPPA